MISKLFVFILTLSIAASAGGNPSGNATCETRLNKVSAINDGFYGGLTLGYTHLVGQLNRSLNFNISDRTTSVGEKNFSSGAFVGYQKIFERNIYIAAEGFYQYANILIEKEETALPGYINYLTHIKKSHRGGVVAKIGFIHSNNMFYLKTGVVLSRFGLTFRNQNYVLNPRGIASIHKMQRGVMLGTGMDYFITRNFAVGMEYEVVNYPAIMKFKLDEPGGFSFKSTSHTFNLRFKYTI